MTTKTALPLPTFFDPKHAGDWDYDPNQAALFAAALDWRKRFGLKASSTDRKKVYLLSIDRQKDFCMKRGALYVGGRSGEGAIDDSRRSAEFIYRNLGIITKTKATFDTHFAYQIFFSAFLVYDDGTPVPAYTEVSVADVERRRVQVSMLVASALGIDYLWLGQHLLHYCRELEREGKYKLYVWPPHCILGSAGHALVGILHEARMFHAFARGAQTDCEVKGGHPLTENYSVLRPEVLTRWDGKPLAQKNVRFINDLLEADYLIIEGEAASHCDKSTIEDLLAEISAKDPKLAEKVYLMEDCMSSVTVPDGKGGFYADYTPQAEAALASFANAGMHVVKSTTPIQEWPGIEL